MYPPRGLPSGSHKPSVAVLGTDHRSSPEETFCPPALCSAYWWHDPHSAKTSYSEVMENASDQCKFTAPSTIIFSDETNPI